MSHCLSNLTISQPISSQRNSTTFMPSRSRFPKWHSSQIISLKNGLNTIKAMTGNAKDNLDHFQRASKIQPQQPKKRALQSAPIGLWDRFPTTRTVEQMMEIMERMMEDPLSYSNGGAWSSQLPTDNGGYRRGRTPWDIKECEGEYKMRFDMPGMTKKDVKIWVEDKMLVVKAEKIDENEGKEEEQEWSAKIHGKYSSRIALPDNIQFEKIKAEVKDGVLYITIPKATTPSKVMDIKSVFLGICFFIGFKGLRIYKMLFCCFYPNVYFFPFWVS